MTDASTRQHSPARRKRASAGALLLAVLTTAQLTIQLDTTIVAVALPSLQADLGISDADRHWSITAYGITFGSLLLLGGRVGDYLGRKRALVWSLIGFGLASLLGGLAVNAGMLHAARGLQGAFAAVMAPAILSLIATSFTEPRQRAKAFAVWGGVGGLGGSLGLIAGGALTEYVSWRWTLLVNTPLTFLIALAAVMVLTESRVVGRPRYDVLGALTSAVGIALIVYGATQAESQGWASRGALIPIAAGTLLLAAFVLIERRSRNPLLPLSVLMNKTRASAFGAMTLYAGAVFASNVLIIYYFQQVRGLTILTSGLVFLPSTIATILFATLGGRLGLRIGVRWVVAIGAASGISGFLLLATAANDTQLGILLTAMALLGAAVGLIWPALSSAALSGVRDDDTGAAGGTVTAVQQVGGSIIVAVLNTVAAAVTVQAGALMPGLATALVICAALTLMTGLIALGISTTRIK